MTERERYKVPYTGHFLYRGAPLDLYRKLERDLEKRVVLTSGIRSVVKQTHLSSPGPSRQRVIFRGRPGRSRLPDIPTTASATLAWARSASVGRTSPRRSPGPRSTTRLVDLGYVDMRYPEGNLLGVRYEPWHIQVTSA